MDARLGKRPNLPAREVNRVGVHGLLMPRTPSAFSRAAGTSCNICASAIPFATATIFSAESQSLSFDDGEPGLFGEEFAYTACGRTVTRSATPSP
jgi:hypothetical protein